MTDRWMIVGQDPAPTADDLPVAIKPSGHIEPSFWLNDADVDDLDDGDRWCRVTLPPEPEPEDDGVEVDGVRYRLQPGDPRWIGRHVEAEGWIYCTSASLVTTHAQIAAALGLVPPPVDERVQAVIDAARDLAICDLENGKPNSDKPPWCFTCHESWPCAGEELRQALAALTEENRDD